MKKVFFFLFPLNWIFTLLNQIVYHYQPGGDSDRYKLLATEYCNLNFVDPGPNNYGHTFYAAFLGITTYVFSYNVYLVGFFQTLIFTLSAVLLVQELEVYLNKKLTGLLLLLFIIPEIHFFNGFMLTESLTFSLILFTWWAALKIVNRGLSLNRLIVVSLFIGFATLNRVESFICVPPILFLIFPQIKSRLIGNTMVLMLFSVLFLLMIGYKNLKTYDDFKVTAYNGGEVIYSGNNENLDGSNHNFWKYHDLFIPSEYLGQYKKIVLRDSNHIHAIDSFYKALAVKAWQKDPIAQLGVIPEKLAKNWLLPGNFDVYTSDTTKTRGLQMDKILSAKYFNNNRLAPAKHMFYMIIYWCTLIMVVFGITNADKRSRFHISILLLLMFNLLLTIPFCGLPRWHVTIMPILIVAFTPTYIIDKLNAFVSERLGFLRS